MNKKQNPFFAVIARLKLKPGLFIIVALGILVYFFSVQCDILEQIVEFSREHEDLEIDETITVFLFLVLAFAFIAFRQWRRLLLSEKELSQKNEELNKALSEIKQLKGIVPICSSCKRIRNDKGFWQHVEEYVSEHSEAEFSHGICPECMKRLYPDLSEDKVK